MYSNNKIVKLFWWFYYAVTELLVPFLLFHLILMLFFFYVIYFYTLVHYPGYIWYYVCNGEFSLTGEDLAFISDNITAVSMVHPTFSQFLFGNNAFLRVIYQSVIQHSEIFKRVAPNNGRKLNYIVMKLV